MRDKNILPRAILPIKSSFCFPCDPRRSALSLKQNYWAGLWGVRCLHSRWISCLTISFLVRTVMINNILHVLHDWHLHQLPPVPKGHKEPRIFKPVWCNLIKKTTQSQTTKPATSNHNNHLKVKCLIEDRILCVNLHCCLLLLDQPARLAEHHDP